MILTLPMAEAIKRRWPQAFVAVLASEANAEAARHHPDVDCVLTDSREAKGSGLGDLLPLVRQLRSGRFEVAVTVHPTPRLALAAWWARIPVRIGTTYRAYSLLFNARVRQHRRGQPGHESEFNLGLLRPLGVVATAPAQGVKWSVRDEERKRAEALLSEIGAHGPYVILHPGNGGSAWNWSSAQYASFGCRVRDEGYDVLVTGSARERDLAERVATRIGPAARSLAGKVSLGEFAAVLERAHLFLGSSTGPTHLAAILGTPVVALFGPLQSHAPERWRPLGPRVTVVQPDTGRLCPRCIGSKCPAFFCMEERLSVERVWAQAEPILRSARSHAAGRVDS